MRYRYSGQNGKLQQLWVFGYGSLVNPATHSFAEHVPATLHGWRRQWRHWVNGPTRFATSLTAEPDPTTNIHGLLARVPEAEWDALDEREKGYDRITIPSASGTDVRRQKPRSLRPAPDPAVVPDV